MMLLYRYAANAARQVAIKVKPLNHQAVIAGFISGEITEAGFALFIGNNIGLPVNC